MIPRSLRQINVSISRATRSISPNLIHYPRVGNNSLQLTRSFKTTTSSLVNYRRFGDPPTNRTSTKSSPFVITTSPSFKSSYNSSKNPFRNFRNPPTIVYIIVGGGFIYYLTHLEQVEITKRWRFMDVSKANEVEIGKQSFNQVMQEYKGKILPKNHPTSRYVRKVSERIVEASGLEGDWECFVVEDDKNMNAFVLPGGKIFVFTGILPICANENGLSVVLGHEIAHQVARHSAERLSSMKVLFALSILLDSLGLDIGISRILLNLFLTLPNSRKAESEADFIGLGLANRACFDPREGEALWRRMEQAEKKGVGGGSGGVDFLSTHPASGKRVEKNKEWAKDVMRDRPEQCASLDGQFSTFMQRSNAPGGRWR